MCATIVRIGIRGGTPDDAQDLCAIYAPYVLNTTITFETEVPSAAEFAGRIRDYSGSFPFLVCLAEFSDGTNAICGYAYGSPQGTRASYRWNIQYSVYLDQRAWGKGIAAALYQALEEQAKIQGYKTAYALIACPNPNSERFHTKWGFSPLALHPKTGYKNGTWLDVLWMSKQLGAYDTPAELIAPGLLPQQTVAAIYAEAVKTVNARLLESLSDKPAK